MYHDVCANENSCIALYNYPVFNNEEYAGYFMLFEAAFVTDMCSVFHLNLTEVGYFKTDYNA